MLNPLRAVGPAFGLEGPAPACAWACGGLTGSCRAVMSSNGETSVVLQGVTHGAVDFLIKPVRIEELRNLWQHVIRRRRDQVLPQTRGVLTHYHWPSRQAGHRAQTGCQGQSGLEVAVCAGAEREHGQACGPTHAAAVVLYMAYGHQEATSKHGGHSMGASGVVAVHQL